MSEKQAKAKFPGTLFVKRELDSDGEDWYNAEAAARGLAEGAKEVRLGIYKLVRVDTVVERLETVFSEPVVAPGRES